jgi:glycosyltransferase involved in cell wall biosynthesis
VGGFARGLAEETVDGYRIIRLGNRYTVYVMAFLYYRKHLRGWPEVIIDEINTVPFFGKSYGVKKSFLFVHQLCREIWFYQMFFPLNLIGYLIEPIYLWLLSDQQVITVSESTKHDLLRYGFKAENVHIISEGIDVAPVPDLEGIKKHAVPTVLSFGAVRAMKRTDHIVQAVEIVRREIPNLRLIVAGDVADTYGKKLLKKSRAGTVFLGRVSQERKLELMQKCHIIAVTSVKEGWGLIVTEANSQGTPAIVYDVDGLRDSVRDGETGIVTKENTPEELAREIVKILKNPAEYERLRKNGWEWSKKITFEKSFMDFVGILIRLSSRT